MIFRPVSKIPALLAVLWCLPAPVCMAGPDLATIRGRIVATMLEQAPRDGAADALRKSLNADGTWPGIDYKDLSNTGFQHSTHLSNMLTMAVAWRHGGSRLHRDPGLLQAVEKALACWVRNDFICENWWHNQIGTPNSLVGLMLLMGDALPRELVDKAQPIIGRAHLNATGARPSGDRIKIAGILAKNLVFLDRADSFGEVMKVIEGEIRFSTGPGMQHDFSFHHRTDGVNNTLSYGIGYAEAFAEWAAYVAGTRHAFSEGKRRLLTDYHLDGICRHLDHRGYPDPGAMNREMSRQRSLAPAGTGIARKLLKTGNYRKNELVAAAGSDRDGRLLLRPHCTSFWRTDHLTFRRPGFFASVRMHSNRNFNMEVPYNSEGLLNHHRGDGANHVLLDGDEYHNIWPVFDMQRIPGTTVMRKPQLPPPNQIHKRGLSDFAGAVTDGLRGAAAFDFKSPHDPLVARKAWFFFDDAYVCLGAGITCTGDGQVVTTVNQCLLKGEVTTMTGRGKSAATAGGHALDGVKWVLHNGIGYVFPTRSRVHLSNQKQSGSWLLHSQQSRTSKETLHIPVFKLWIDHGTKPQNDSYAYFVVPGTTADEMEQSVKTRPITILENRPDLQAVRHAGLGIYHVVFHQPGTVRIAQNKELASSSPAMVMLKIGAGKVREITVADPTHRLAGIRLSVPAKLDGKGGNFTTVWNENTQTSDLAIDLPQGPEAGRSVTIRF